MSIWYLRDTDIFYMVGFTHPYCFNSKSKRCRRASLFSELEIQNPNKNTENHDRKCEDKPQRWTLGDVRIISKSQRNSIDIYCDIIRHPDLPACISTLLWPLLHVLWASVPQGSASPSSGTSLSEGPGSLPPTRETFCRSNKSLTSKCVPYILSGQLFCRLHQNSEIPNYSADHDRNQQCPIKFCPQHSSRPRVCRILKGPP